MKRHEMLLSAVLLVFAMSTALAQTAFQDYSLSPITGRTAERLVLDQAFVEEHFGRFASPDELRAGLDDIGILPLTITPAFGTPYFDDSGIGLGSGTYFPVDPRNRRSVYELDMDETVLTGMFIGERGVFYRYFTRLSGSGPAEPGDVFGFAITDATGEIIVANEGPLVVFDEHIGYGYLDLPDQDLVAWSVWVGWSLIRVAD